MDIALTILCAVCSLAFIAAEYREKPVARAAAKTLASVAFVTLAFTAPPASAVHVPFARWILIGLVLGAIGDVALLGHSTRAFLGGLVAFLGGHVAYIFAAAQLAPPSTWASLGGPAIAAPILGGAIALAWLWRHLGALRIPVIGYVIAIIAMVVAAIALAIGGLLPAPPRTLFLVGAVLFFVSDLSVARNRFVQRSITNLVWGIPAYYAAQLLIAWSLFRL